MAIVHKRMFPEKKLLLVLDDVGNKDQLNKLAKRDNWFGPESVVIITTRNKDVTVESAVNLSYELNELHDDQSYQLFCKHAFGKDASCSMDSETIAKDIVSTTGGLPLAIEVIGSFLSGKNKDVWEDTLKKLRKKPNNEVQEKLRISYDALEEEQQQIFLDIACLPIRHEYHYASCMWDSCDFFPKEGIQVLMSLSLIKLGDEDRIIMHDQLIDLGREIVRKEGCNNNIGLRSRLWVKEEALEVIERKQGTTSVQALVLDFMFGDIHCTSQQFEGITNLRYLFMYDVYPTGDFENPFLNLRWLHWSNTSEVGNFMGINFNPKKLVILHLGNSNITECWKGWSQVKYLKFLYLGRCNQLTTTPNFSALKELEELELDSCEKLRKIHPSIGKFNKSLKVLRIWHCDQLNELPIEVGKMDELRELDIYDSGIREIPVCEGYMKKLKTLKVTHCPEFTSIPESIGSLVELQSMVLSVCKSLREIPDSIGDLYNLESLKLDYTSIKCLPASIRKLTKLRRLNIPGCNMLESLANLPCSLRSLQFHGDPVETFPDISSFISLNDLIYTHRHIFERRNIVMNFGKLRQLNAINFRYSGTMGFDDWIELDEAPEDSTLLELPSDLENLKVEGCQHLLYNGSVLNLQNPLQSDLNGRAMMMDLTTLGSLDTLHLSNANKLVKLTISGCIDLEEIQGLDNLEGLQKLEINGCCSIERIGNLSHLKMLTSLALCACEKLSEVQGIEKLTTLTHLSFSGCHPKVKFLDLSMLRNLICLTIKDEELKEIPGIQESKSMEVLDISGCKSFLDLPDLSQFPNLRELKVMDCEKFRKLLYPPNVCVKLVPLEEEAGEIMPDKSRSENSNDIVEGSCEISLGCLTFGCSSISQMLRSVMTHLRRIATISQI